MSQLSYVKSLLELLDIGMEWAHDAACKGADPEKFFPERGDETDTAKRICQTCPCRDDCLDYALRTKQQHGIWGGTSYKERRKIWRSQKEDAA